MLTVTGRVAGAATRAPGTKTIICVGVMLEGLIVEPPICTVAPAAKLDPVIVSVNGPPPALTVFGVSALIVGGGFTVRFRVLETSPPTFVTRTGSVPALPITLAGTVTVMLVADIVRGMRFAPPTCTVAP